MPYNNTPIAPSKEVTGHVSLPLARVQKIIHADPERLNVTKNAAFAIALATEMFIQHLATTTHNVVKTERKPRRNIQYRDVSSAIAKTDNLEFAVDVVPKTMLWKEAKKRREEREEREKMVEEGKGKGKGKDVNGTGNAEDNANGDSADGGAEENGDELNGHVEEAATNGVEASVSASPVPAAKPDAAPEAMEVDERVEDSEPEEDAAAMQLEMEMRGPPRPKTESPEAKTAPVPAPAPAPMVTTRRSAGGFTSINGAR